MLLNRVLIPLYKHILRGYVVCAKSGEQIFLAFREVVAVLSGVKIHPAELERAKRVMKADIEDHPNIVALPLKQLGSCT